MPFVSSSDHKLRIVYEFREKIALFVGPEKAMLALDHDLTSNVYCLPPCLGLCKALQECTAVTSNLICQQKNMSRFHLRA